MGNRLLLLMGCALGLVGSARADLVIGFDTLATDDSAAVSRGFTYEENGFVIESLSSGVLASFGSHDSRYSGSASLANTTIGGLTRLSRAGGGTFDLLGIDLARVGRGAPSVTFTGELLGGGTVTQTLAVSSIGHTPQTFAFSGFAGLLSVSWVQSAPFHQFDNIRIASDIPATPIPTPTAGVLGLIGAAWVGAVRRRR